MTQRSPLLRLVTYESSAVWVAYGPSCVVAYRVPRFLHHRISTRAFLPASLARPKRRRRPYLALPLIVIAELRAWRLRQSEELLRLGIRLTDDTFVCAREDGSTIQPNSIGHAWDRFIASTDLPRIRFQDLRHGHATALVANGVHPKVASERLGHSRVALTLDTYSHVIPGMQEDAVARIDAAFGSALM